MEASYKCQRCENYIDHGYLCRKCEYKEKKEKMANNKANLANEVQQFKSASSTFTLSGIVGQTIGCAIIFGLIALYNYTINDWQGFGFLAEQLGNWMIMGALFPLFLRLIPMVVRIFKVMDAGAKRLG